jgi:hypothetical protein
VPEETEDGGVSDLKPHEILALEFLRLGPDRIKVVENDETFAAALVFLDLEKRGFVHVDKDDGMLITIAAAGMDALDQRKASA